MLKSAKSICGTKPNKDKFEREKIAVGALFSHLLRCLPDHATDLIRGLPHWTYDEAGIESIEAVTVTPAHLQSDKEKAIGDDDKKSEKFKQTDIVDVPHPHRVWCMLSERYAPNTNVHVRLLQSKLYRLTMDTEYDFMAYVSQIDSLCARLAELNDSVSDRTKMAVLLSGLPSSAGTAVTTIDTSRDIKSYRDAVTYLTDYFANLAGRAGTVPAASPGLITAAHTFGVSLAMTSNSGASSSTADTRCSACNKKGHTPDGCWKLHPELRPAHMGKHKRNASQHANVKGANKSKGSNDVKHNSEAAAAPKRDVQCDYCMRYGHTEDECKTKQRAKERREEKEQTAVTNTNQKAAINRTWGNRGIAMPVYAVSACTDDFIVDSGSSFHMCNQASMFSDLHDLAKPQSLDSFQTDARATIAYKCGSVPVTTSVNGVVCTYLLHDVLYVPTSRTSLLSPGLMHKQRPEYMAVSSSSSWTWYDANKQPVMQATRASNDTVWLLNIVHKSQSSTPTASTPTAALAQSSESKDAATSLTTWHCRLGHTASPTIIAALRAAGITMPSEKQLSHVCPACAAGKITRAPFPKQARHRAREPMERIHTDIAGPVTPESIDGYKYVCTFTDDATRYSAVEVMRYKSDFFKLFADFSTFHSKHLEKKIKYLRRDNAGENTSNELQAYLLNNGIKDELTVPYTPQQNGVAERKNRTLFERARAYMQHATMPKSFWADALYLACDVMNNLPNKGLGGRTPASCFGIGTADLHEFKIFGCAAYAKLPNVDGAKLPKLDARAHQCVWLGRDQHSAGYRLYDLEDSKLIVSRDFIVDETRFPFKEQFDEYERDVGKEAADEARALPEFDGDSDSDFDPTVDGSSGSDSDDDGAASPTDAHGARDHDSNSSSSSSSNGSSGSSTDIKSNAQAQPTRHSTRSNFGVGPLRYGGGVDPRMCVFNVHDGDDVIDSDEPRTLSEALSMSDAKEWRAAAQKEIDALHTNGTWTLSPLPVGRKPIKTTWVFKRKRNPDGSIEKYKARLCAKGFTQKPGIDYSDTYAPVPQPKTVRTVLALAAHMHLSISQYDVESAFLNGVLNEDLYMKQPDGFDDGSGRVCHLRKAIYGLKQASRVWIWISSLSQACKI